MTATLSKSPWPVSAEIKNRYVFQTVKGAFYIAEADGQFLGVLGRKCFQSHATPEQVAKDFAFGLCGLDGLDTSALRIPQDLKKWQAL